MRSSAIAILALLALLAAGCGGGGGGGGRDGTPALGQRGDEEDAAADLGFPSFATKNTTRVGGADAVANAAAVALATYPARTRETRPAVVTLVDRRDWRTAISAAQLVSAPARAPILFTDGSSLPPASKAALDQLRPTGSQKAGGAQVLRVGTSAEPAGLKDTTLQGRGYAALARAIDRFQTALNDEPSDAVVVAPADSPEFAMPAAGWAAKSGQPVLWVTRTGVPPETRQAIASHGKPRIYVLGPESVVPAAVFDRLKSLGTVKRVSGPDPVRNAIAFARYSDGSFGWNVVDPGHGLVFANSTRFADAAAAAPLSSSGTYGPLLLVSAAGTLPPPLQDYLLDIQPGYERDPVRGVYNHGWLMGDEKAISADVQSRIDALLEIQPVQSSS